MQKLSDEQVAEIRARHAAGEGYEELAAAYGVSVDYTGCLIRGAVRGPNPAYTRPSREHFRQCCEDGVLFHGRGQQGVHGYPPSNAELARMLGLNPTTVARTLDRLEAKGKIRRRRGATRGVDYLYLLRTPRQEAEPEPVHQAAAD